MIDTKLYDYKLDPSLIATKPKEKRDESRLFIFDTKSGIIRFDTFKNIDKYIPDHSLLVLNETKVVPARLDLFKKTGGKVQVLFLADQWKDGSNEIQGLVDRKVCVGEILHVENYSFEAVAQDQCTFTFKINFPPDELLGLFNKFGQTPIPKYIKGTFLPESALRERYQTVFAKGLQPDSSPHSILPSHSPSYSPSYSVAAPTASLHFTEQVFNNLAKNGIETAKISLNVGLGTFKPLTEENIKSNKLHAEYFYISKESAQKMASFKEKGNKVVAVGTTTVRTLETWANESRVIGSYPISPNSTIKEFKGSTNIFIHPPFDFKVVDCLITNFHLPNSSLMMLVEAFL